MSIKVKFFARMRDEAGISTAELDFRENLKPEDIWNELSQNKDYPESVMLAVNMEYVSGVPELKDGDEIAFFPPVTGG